jgi:integrase
MPGSRKGTRTVRIPESSIARFSLAFRRPFARNGDMYEREITPMDFRAINRAVSRRAASGAPDAKAMRALRPALWFLWLSGARVEEMRFAHWDEFRPVRARLVVHARGKDRVLDLSPQACKFLRWLQDRRPPGQRCIFPGPEGNRWDLAEVHAMFAQAVALAYLPRLSIRAIRLAHAGRAEGHRP